MALPPSNETIRRALPVFLFVVWALSAALPPFAQASLDVPTTTDLTTNLLRHPLSNNEIPSPSQPAALADLGVGDFGAGIHHGQPQTGRRSLLLTQDSQAEFLAMWDTIIANSHSDPTMDCGNRGPLAPGNVTISAAAPTVSASAVQAACALNTLCVIPAGVTLTMDDNLSVGALLVYGDVVWDTTTQTLAEQVLCAGYVAFMHGATFNMNMDDPNVRAKIYIVNNGATHDMLGFRVFGGEGATIHMSGAPLVRTWSLIAEPVAAGADRLPLMHDPQAMGWRVGDRIQIAPTDVRSTGAADTFTIAGFDSGAPTTILLGDTQRTSRAFESKHIVPTSGEGVALLSAEVINLSRNVIITGDDFEEVPCRSDLPDTGSGLSSKGCRCAGSRTSCTVGLHTIMMHGGSLRVQYVRVEKGGQRGVMGKYPLHFHHMGACPDCLFHGNAVEFSMQRGIVVHGTHLSTVSENTLSDVRGAGIYVEDGNEMGNTIAYNAVVCPWALTDPEKGGCTVPGTDNSQGDTSVNQAGLYMVTPSNHLLYNRVANSFNGMLVDGSAFANGRGLAQGKVCTEKAKLGRFAGNTFHSHGRFGTYLLNNNFPKATVDASVTTGGLVQDRSTCTSFAADGTDTGLSQPIVANVDWGTAFVGSYNMGDVQFQSHVSYGSSNLLYWKETKSMADGCAAHILNSHMDQGNVALPDGGVFLIQDSHFGAVSIETNHHCNVGVTGILCQPMMVFVSSTVSADARFYFQNLNFQSHSSNANYGGMYVLAPPEEDNPDGGVFPPGYCSFTSGHYPYLVSLPECDVAEDAVRYDGGILCSKPLRALRIYSRGVTSATAVPLLVHLVRGGAVVASQSVIFHQIGSDGQTRKTGYSLPVMVGLEATAVYRVGLDTTGDGTTLGAIPADWVIEFSDPVFYNRWGTLDEIRLEVTGRSCPAVLTNLHDRRYVYADSTAVLPDEAYGRGACTAHPDMPAVTCAAVPELDQYSRTCGPLDADGDTSCGANQYYDCDRAACVCKDGFIGADCSVDVCASSACGPHGRCTAKALGAGVSPDVFLAPALHACVCEDQWTGPTCEVNPCAGQSCGDHGSCVVSESSPEGWACVCDQGWSGDACDLTCDGVCQGTYPYGCNAGVSDPFHYCGPSGGCSYQTSDEGHIKPNGWCRYKGSGSGGGGGGGGSCDGVTCTAPDDCHEPGTCSSGVCSEPTPKTDGALCDGGSGTCQSGTCVAAESGPCDGVCVGSWDAATPYGCNAGVTAPYHYCGPSGGCSYQAIDQGEIREDGWCRYKDPCTGVSCPAPADECQTAGVCSLVDGTCGPTTPVTDGTPCDSGTGTCQSGTCLHPCEGVCTGGVWDPIAPYGCSGTVANPHLYCGPTGGCWYSDNDYGDFLDNGWCRYINRCEGVVCEAPNECTTPGVCGAYGQCSAGTPVTDGTPCDESGGVCRGGECFPPTHVCELVCQGSLATAYSCDASDPAPFHYCGFAAGQCDYVAEDAGPLREDGWCRYKAAGIVDSADPAFPSGCEAAAQ